jgi:acyl phosphate:glycerol-3-phosphate acyltransferase
VSLASITAAALIPAFVWLLTDDVWPLLVATVVGAMLIIFAHRGNIRRLVEGTESKFRFKQ